MLSHPISSILFDIWNRVALNVIAIVMSSTCWKYDLLSWEHSWYHAILSYLVPSMIVCYRLNLIAMIIVAISISSICRNYDSLPHERSWYRHICYEWNLNIGHWTNRRFEKKMKENEVNINLKKWIFDTFPNF